MTAPWPNTFPFLSQPCAQPLPASGLARLSWTVPAALVDTVPPFSRGIRAFELSGWIETRPRWRMQLSVLDDTQDVQLSGTAGSASGMNSSSGWVWSGRAACC